MSVKSKKLREERAALAAKARTDILAKAEAEGRDLSAEEKEQWEKIMGGTRPDGTTVRGQVDLMKDAIDREESLEKIELDLGATVTDPRIGRGPIKPPGRDGGALTITDEIRTLAIAGWLAIPTERGATADQADAMQALGINPHAKSLTFGLYETPDMSALQRRFRAGHHSTALDRCSDFRATLTQGSGPAGGYLIAPEQMRTTLEINMLAYGGMRQASETIRTATGEPFSWPTADDTTNTGVQLAESTSIGSSVDPTFGKVLWYAYDFSSKLILVPVQLLQDSVFNLPAVIGQMLGERLGRITNTKYTTGTGAATPKGIITCASSFSAGAATAISFDDVLGLEHSIDPAYRPGAGYMANDAILLAIRKLKDADGRPLWQTNLSVGMPDTLNARPITLNQDMDSTIASGKKTLLFGNYQNYKIRSVNQIQLVRLDERYADLRQVAFIAFIREDGNLLTSGTTRVKYLSH